MTALELIQACAGEPPHYQLHINAFIDDFRKATAASRARMVSEGPAHSGRIEGLVTAVVSALCREVAMPTPGWVQYIHSPEPFFVLPARGFALRVRLMLESPPAFRCRNVFVPENYLARA
jgi:hypothetical protein